MLWLVQSVGTRGLPVMTAADLATADFSSAAFREYCYEGEIVSSDGRSDKVSLVPMPGQGLRLQIWLANSEGVSLLAGSVIAETGAFGAGPNYEHGALRGGYHVEGRLRGPALVDGVPTAHLEATVHRLQPRVPAYEGPIVRRWTGLLRATARTRL